jgi:hypothetical protein
VKIAWVQLGDVQSALCVNGLVWELHSLDAAEASEVQGAACGPSSADAWQPEIARWTRSGASRGDLERSTMLATCKEW